MIQTFLNYNKYLKAILILFICVVFSLDMFSQNVMKELETSALSIGETVKVHSKVLDEDRLLNIYLPYGYSPDSLQTYPVIYLLDGSIDEDFIHIAGLVQFASFSWINIIPESIVVGIVNVDRKRDFTFPSNNKEDNHHAPTSGKSEYFMDFIEKELRPYIDQEYKSNGKNILIGQFSLNQSLTTQKNLFLLVLEKKGMAWKSWQKECMISSCFGKRRTQESSLNILKSILFT